MSKIFRASVLGLGVGVAALVGVALPQAAFAFGAIAISSEHGGVTGWSHDYGSKDRAEEVALQECGPGCRVVLDFWNGCGAYAVDAEAGSTVYGWGTGSTRRAAERKAIAGCEDNDGDQCVIKVWACE